MGRIVDYPEITTLSDGDYLIVDNAEGGTKKVSAPLVAGTVDPTPTEDSTNAVSSGGVWTSLNDISEEFDGLRTDAYDVYPKGIASGDIVQFETGADNVPLSDLTGYIYPTMSGSGMPSRTNIRTISGPDDINIYQRNKNLIEQITYQSEPETVYLGVQNSSNLTMFFKAGDYRITVNIVGGSTVVPYWAIGSTATHSEYMHLDNDTNVSIYVYDADGISASDIASFQVEVGTEATDYVEFEGDITNVVLPTDRGTIYSGRVALTAGKVYIDTVIYERNSSTMNNTEDKPGWAYTGLQTYDVAIGTFDDVIYWPNGDVRCTNVNVGSTYSIEVANEDYSLILPRDVYNMSQSQWISAGVDIQILVKLNTPIEIDIDPVEVRSLYGFNTYYCNSGKTGVIFGMDLAKYISDKTSDVEDEAKKKIEKAFVTDTASGAVATFADGADDIPMKSVKVAIEPVQDLHGYDHPWPAGGGANKFDGIVVADGSYSLSANYIPVTEGQTWYIYAPNFPANENCYCRLYDSNFSEIDAGTPQRIGRTTTYTIPNGVAYIKLRYWSTFDATNMAFNYPATVTAYSPYSNICPISGWTGAQVVRTGVNVWDEEWEVGSINVTTGEDEPNNSMVRCAGYIKAFPNKTYYISNPESVVVSFYDAEKNYIDATTRQNQTFTTPSNAAFIRFRTSFSYGGTYNHDISINYPSTDRDYEPYAGNTYPITFPTEAGTVYGGTLDVTNGVLTVDRAIVDLGTLDWYVSSNPAGMVGSNMDVLTFPSALYSNPNVVSDVMCEKFKTSKYNSVTTGADDGIAVFGSGDARYIRIFYDGYIGKTAAEVKADLDGVKLIYTLLTPIVYTLTPTEIKSLLGDNNVWADAGDTEVTYRADTKLYIEKLTQPEEDDMIADSNIVSGQYFMVGNSLYLATANIASGAAVVVGTNATAKTMAEALNEINA